VDWYFDFISPYSYLQSERMPQWPAGVTLRARPVVLAGILSYWGQRGPAEVTPKRTFTYRQVQWLAARDGVRLRFPPRHPFNPIGVLRLAVSLDDDLDAIRTIFRYIWAEGGAVDTPEGWKALQERLRIDDGDARIADHEVKTKLRRYGDEAISRGVFGVPTLAIDDMLVFGYDSTNMALDYLRDPSRFRNEEMRRVDNLPVGASRI
jgi:2-hydroxychromene-2-carboxylate isomerase